MEPTQGVVALFAAAKIARRSLQTFPADFSNALQAGKVTLEVLQRFLTLESQPLAHLVWGIQGFRERLLADPSFPVKVGIEVGIGIITKIAAEKTRRGSAFWSEIDFVSANVVMAIIADFMLVWLPAPILSYTSHAETHSSLMLGGFCASCPDNAFQRVQPGMEDFTAGHRFGAIMCNGMTLMCVGFWASMLGVGITNLLVAMRKMLNPTKGVGGGQAWGRKQQVLKTSAAYGVYMATSSNLRYQVIAGIIEERGIEVMFKGHRDLCALLSFIIRTANTFLGSVLWVDFVRLMGMQVSPPTVKIICADEENNTLITISSSEWKTKTP